MLNVFIDGRAGTTGLRIVERLTDRTDIKLMSLSELDRKDPKKREECINSSDLTFLCLPDDAARESVSMVKNDKVKIIDASTAHRTNPKWAYGFPELGADFRDKIISSKRVVVPGCHASGFLSIAYPLIKLGVISKTSLLTCFSLTGFSGGGNALITSYNESNQSLKAPREYALSQTHKHLPEMQYISQLECPPNFNPIVCDYYCGMAVTVPLFKSELKKVACLKDIYSLLNDFYKKEKLVSVFPLGEGDKNGFISADILKNKDYMKIHIGGNDERISITSLLDNLGKGASGAAVQCMNLMMGCEETKGLCKE